jgi:hypothetical protein
LAGVIILFSSVAAASPTVTNCYPFGGGAVGWGSYLFFKYSNLPAFTVVAGDILAYDLGNANDFTPAFASIAVATPTEDSTGSYTTIVPDSAADSKGDTIIGNFDLRFTITAPYAFPGGTLYIRFQNGGTAASNTGFSSDATCTQVHVAGSSSDASGYASVNPLISFLTGFADSFLDESMALRPSSAQMQEIQEVFVNLQFILALRSLLQYPLLNQQ